MGLMVALGDDQSAEGFLYWDDGETRGGIKKKDDN